MLAWFFSPPTRAESANLCAYLCILFFVHSNTFCETYWNAMLIPSPNINKNKCWNFSLHVVEIVSGTFKILVWLPFAMIRISTEQWYEFLQSSAEINNFNDFHTFMIFFRVFLNFYRIISLKFSESPAQKKPWKMIHWERWKIWQHTI